MDKWVREYDTAKFIRDFEKEFGSHPISDCIKGGVTERLPLFA